LINIYELILLVRFIMEIIRGFQQIAWSTFFSNLYGFAFNITEPLIEWVRSLIPTTFQNIDFSYIILLLGFEIIKKLLFILF